MIQTDLSGPTLIERNEQPFLIWDSSNDPMKNQDRFMERIVVHCINVGIFLEKRRLVLEEMDALGYSWTCNIRSSMEPRERNLKKRANQLETEIVELEDAVKKDKARLTNLLSRA